MDIAQCQKVVAEFVDRHDFIAPADKRLLDLVSEVGELAKAFLSATSYGRTPFEPTESWSDEFGDVFFSFVCLSNVTNVNIERALLLSIEKYEHRLRRGGAATNE